MQRGEIWWADSPVPTGSSPGYRRPVLIVQSDDFNRSKIQTVVVVAITSNVALAAAPGNVLLTKRESGLRSPSVANVSQVLTIDKSLLASRVRALPATKMTDVNEGMALVLGLS